MRAYPDICRARLVAMRVETEEVKRNGLVNCVRQGRVDLSTYLKDPHLPMDLRAGVEELMRELCGAWALSILMLPINENWCPRCSG